MTERSGKASARQAARAVRAAAHAAAHAAAGTGAAERLALHVAAALGSGAGVVAGYLPIGSEIDPRPAMRDLRAAGWQVAVPVVDGPARPLGFRLWTPDAPLLRGAFGVAEPSAGAAVEPDVLLVPLLAFDGALHRLGYGGGYYDRTLADLRRRRPVRAYGVAYAAQEVAAVPREATDAVLDAVVTEAGLVGSRG